MIHDLITHHRYMTVTQYLLLFIFLLTPILSSPALANHEHESEGISDWKYRWGDSPWINGHPTWISTAERASEQWKDIDVPVKPPNRQDHNTVWFKATLPASGHDYLHPVLYITSIDLMAEVFIDGEKIYQFGDFEKKEKKTFYGWPWHSISLPNDYVGKTIYFRVFSNYPDIGLWGEVKLFEQSNLLFYLLKDTYFETFVVLFSFFVTMITFAFSMMQKGERHFLYLSAFSLTSALMLLAENDALQFVFNYPLFRVYLLAISYYALPVFICLLLSSWSSAWQQNWLKRIAWFHILYLLTALALSLSGVIELAITFPIFDALFVVSILIIIGLAVSMQLSSGSDQKLVMLSFIIYGFFLLLDMGIANSILPWMDLDVSIAGLLFSLVLIIISLRHYSHVQKALKELNDHLEVKVAERTASLHAYAEAEQERAEQLHRLNLLGAKLEELNSRLQACQDLHEAKKILVRKLPEVFMPVEVSVVTSYDNKRFDLQLAQIELQHLDGSYSVFVYIMLTNASSKLLIPRENLDDLISRVKLRLGVTLSSIKLREELHRFSFEDALTGLRNRRYFDDALYRETQLANREMHTLSLLICDIDHFKRFNDEYGHEVGDCVLKTLAQLMQEFFRETDIPCRFGGEEFVVLMPSATLTDATHKAEALRKTIAKKNIEFNGEDLGHITISVGVANISPFSSDSQQLLSEADKALYKAKQSGRNRVESVQL